MDIILQEVAEDITNKVEVAQDTIMVRLHPLVVEIPTVKMDEFLQDLLIHQQKILNQLIHPVRHQYHLLEQKLQALPLVGNY